jgi:hypothetical protein
MSCFELWTGGGVTEMSDEIRQCRLRRPVRDREGRSRFGETALIIQELRNLERLMYLVRFEDGSTTFLFPEEIEIIPPTDDNDGRAGG